jgi:hypothetical protein
MISHVFQDTEYSICLEFTQLDIKNIENETHVL